MFDKWARNLYRDVELTPTGWNCDGVHIIYDGTFRCWNGSSRIPVHRTKSRLGPEYIYIIAKTMEEATRLVRNMYRPEHLPPTLEWVPFRKHYPYLELNKTYDLYLAMPFVVDTGFCLKWGREIG